LVVEVVVDEDEVVEVRSRVPNIHPLSLLRLALVGLATNGVVVVVVEVAVVIVSSPSDVSVGTTVFVEVGADEEDEEDA